MVKKLIFGIIGITLVAAGLSVVGLLVLRNNEDSPFAGGITRTKIGGQTAWTTDLIPSASFTVNLGSNALPVNQIFGSKASISNSEFSIYASASAFKGAAFPSTNCTSSNNFIQWATTGIFTCGITSSADPHIPFVTIGNTASLSLERALTGTANQITVTDNGANSSVVLSVPSLFSITTASLSANFEVGGYASVGGNIFSAGASIQFTKGSLTTNKGVHATGNIDTVAQIISTGTASNSFSGSLALSKGLTATVGVFSGTGSNSFAGSLKLSKSLTGVDFNFSGTASSSLAGGLVVTKQLYANGGLIFKTSTSTSATLTTAGQSLINTASTSFDYSDGTNQIVAPGPRCFTYIPSPLTSIHQELGKRFLDPFTLIAITSIASPSGNGIKWNLYKGAPGSVTTTIFANDKTASTTSSPVYTTFTNSTLSDGNELDIKITSASNKITQFSVTVCGRYNK